MDVYIAAQWFSWGFPKLLLITLHVHAYIQLECILKKRRMRSLATSHITLETPMVNSITEVRRGRCIVIENQQ